MHRDRHFGFDGLKLGNRLLYNGLEGRTLEMKTAQYGMYFIGSCDLLGIPDGIDNAGMTAPAPSPDPLDATTVPAQASLRCIP